MANSKISALTSATTPLAGTETLPVVQSSTTKQVSVTNLTAGRTVTAKSIDLTVPASSSADQVALKVTNNGENGATIDINNAFGFLGQIAITKKGGGSSADEGKYILRLATNSALSDVVTVAETGDQTLNIGNLVIGTSGKGIDFTAGGVANGVAYLNGSKLLASFSSNFKFDGTTLDLGAVGSNGRLTVKAPSGQRAVLCYNSSGTAYFYTDNDNAVSTGANGADSVLFINKNTSTGRSINAAGTLNALGTDYAEYMTKAGDFVLAKGDVCGINANGKLTNVFSEAVSFVVKSTSPSFVGGDIWGNEEALGLTVPQQSVRILDETEQRLVSEATEDEEAVYETVVVKAGDSDEEWAAKEAAYAADKAAFDSALEAARQKVDRVAFAGQVPVNITGAVPGQYIVPADDNGAIKPTAVDEANMTLAMYMKAVGKVIAIKPDGRAKIIVKTA